MSSSSAFPFGPGSQADFQDLSQQQQQPPQQTTPIHNNVQRFPPLIDPMTNNMLDPLTQYNAGPYQQRYAWPQQQPPPPTLQPSFNPGTSPLQTPRQSFTGKPKMRGMTDVEMSPSLSRHHSDNNVFKNPWYTPGQTPNRIPAAEPPFLMASPGRTQSFANALPTTYEYEGMQHQHLQQQQSAMPNVPMMRSQAPRPPSDYFADPNVRSSELLRRQSVATPYSTIPSFQDSYDYTRPPMSHRNSYIAPSPPKVPAPTMSRVRTLADLHPNLNPEPKYRRASSANTLVSPLNALTTALALTYSMCRSDFDYKSSKNPRRVLTKPSEGKSNNGHDNEHSDYILYVNDVLGSQDGMKYMVLDILGQGTFGQVVKCQNLKTQEIVAVKVIKSKPAFLNQSLTEVKILEHLNKKVDPEDKHHFLRLKDKFIHKNHLCLVFELLSSNLYELIRQNMFRGLALKLVRKFTVQLLDSLMVLKAAKIIHCDLKPENILLVSPDKPLLKVIDFGAACHERQIVYAYIQSRFYRSPEVILGLSYTSSIDMWSLGCIIAELFLGTPLLPGTTEYGQICRIVQMFGMPPAWMIEMGKNAANYFVKENVYDERTGKQSRVYHLKSIEQYSREFNVDEKPGKEYFEDKDLPSIIRNYQLPKKNMTEQMVEREMHQRDVLVHFLQGILNLNPLERWTPQEAAMHPFITEQPFTGTWSPPSASYSELRDKVDNTMDIDPVSFD